MSRTAAATGKATRLIDQAAVSQPKRENDTIRLWESYRDQALLWRSLALLQIPATLVAVLFAWVMWANREITLDVPAKPLPGRYAAQEIHDSEFIEVGTNFINLISSYQPAVARRQFSRAREMVIEPYLTQFNIDVMDKELKTVETTSRTQLFFIDPSKTTIDRSNDKIIVTFIGERQKFVAGKEVDPVTTRYDITLTTVPRNDLNPYGIVVANAFAENVQRK